MYEDPRSSSHSRSRLRIGPHAHTNEATRMGSTAEQTTIPRRTLRREGWVTVQGPVTKPTKDEKSHWGEGAFVERVPLLGDGWPLVILSHPTLCHVSHIICGGEHPQNFTVLGQTLCEAWLSPAWGGTPRSSTTTVPPSHTNTKSVCGHTTYHFPPQDPNQCVHPDQAHLLSLDGKAPLGSSFRRALPCIV